MKTLLYKSGVLLSFFALLVPLLLPVQAQAAVSGWVYKGASFIPQSTTDFGSGDFQQSVRNFKAAGGNTVNFIVPYYQSNSGATDINAGWNTPSDSSLISGIQYVHSLGMKAEISGSVHRHDAASAQIRFRKRAADRLRHGEQPPRRF